MILLAETPATRLISANFPFGVRIDSRSRADKASKSSNFPSVIVLWPIDHFRSLQHKTHGFSLVEVIVAIAIVGLLAAIAIPQFMSYRSEAIDAQLKSDLRNAAVAIEAYYAKKSVLPASVAETAGYGFQTTAGVTLSLLVVSPTAYQLTAAKPGGSQPRFTYDSATGVIH